ncbi:MAG: hypothetical protein ABI591_13210 [Kofleriaceae bacterium]
MVGLIGCVTPSIPIPPPDPSQMDFDIAMDAGSTSSHATFTYPPDQNYADGTAYVFNEHTGAGVFHIVNADFSIGPMTLAASLGDQVVVTIESTSQTVSRCVVLRQGAQDPNTYCTN